MMRSLFRPKSVPGKEVIDDHRGLIRLIERRGLIRGGLSQLKTSNLVPTRTATQLSRDAQVAKEQVQ